MNFNRDFKFGTMGGTVLSIVHSFSLEDFSRTIILGMVGATVSFFMSMFLKWIIGLARSHLNNYFPKRKKKKRKHV